MGLIGAVVIGVIVAALIAWVIISHVKGNRAPSKIARGGRFRSLSRSERGA